MSNYPEGFWTHHIEDPQTGVITHEDGTVVYKPSSGSSDDVMRAHAKGREEGARAEAMEWAERTRFEIIAEAIHMALVDDGTGCSHAVIKRCEQYARAVHRRITA